MRCCIRFMVCPPRRHSRERHLTLLFRRLPLLDGLRTFAVVVLHIPHVGGEIDVIRAVRALIPFTSHAQTVFASPAHVKVRLPYRPPSAEIKAPLNAPYLCSVALLTIRPIRIRKPIRLRVPTGLSNSFCI